MLRYLFIAIVIIHGLIHLLGFVREWHLARVPQLSGKTLFPLGDTLAKTMGILWLLTAVTFSLSAISCIMGEEWWWIVALFSVMASQILIIIYWKDARAGTIANAIIVPVLIVSFAHWSFSTAVNKEVQVLLGRSINNDKTIVSGEMLKGLPPPVRSWLEHSNIIGKEKIQTLRLKQKGTMRNKPDGSWMPFEAEQYFIVDRPAFIWKADVESSPLFSFTAEDKYVDGSGTMLIKLFSMIRVAEGRGKEMDQGSMLRYLAEMIWFPSAALNDYVRWKEIDSVSALATMNYGGITASGIFSFDPKGDIVNFKAQRYGEFNGKYSLETWSIAMTDYRSFDGIMIPSSGEVTWKLRTGDFTWLKLDITELEINKSEPY